MPKNPPADQDTRLALQTVADAAQDQTCQPAEGNIFDDLSLIGALLFGEPIPEMLADEIEPDRRH